MQWTPRGENTFVKVVTTDGAITWQGTYCYGITGDIIYRQPDTMEAYTATLYKWDQEIIGNVEIFVPLDKLNDNAYFCYASPAFGKEPLLETEAYEILSVLCFASMVGLHHVKE
eukprot:15367049-Ditylum_brightwellii.AAC.1